MNRTARSTADNCYVCTATESVHRLLAPDTSQQATVSTVHPLTIVSNTKPLEHLRLLTTNMNPKGADFGVTSEAVQEPDLDEVEQV